MAEEEGGQPFQFTPEGGKPGNSSRDYTGRGLAQYPNNDQYDGYYADGVRNGKGKYAYANEDKYDGEFRNNRKHGIGRLTYKDKGEYYGQWENGLKHGEGTYTYANKDTYSGWWQFGKKHGKGNYTYSDTGMRLIGEWKENKIVQGRWIFPNGTYFEGDFENNKPTKNGTWHFKDGNHLDGVYQQTIIPNEDPVQFRCNAGRQKTQHQVGMEQSKRHLRIGKSGQRTRELLT